MFQSVFIAFAAVLCWTAPGLATTVQYDWDITWVNSAPDGFNRPVIGIDGVWPCPPIRCRVGDQVIVHINNKLGNESTGLHFHGIHQIGTPHMDGPAHGTQCPVPPGYSFTYNFTVDQAGTYWYHSHTGNQYPDGLRGPLIVEDIKDPYVQEYDDEYLLTFSDWYQDEVPTLISQVLSPENTQIRPPLPKAVLINEASSLIANTTLRFEPGKKYKIRTINMSAMAGIILSFSEHIMKVIEIDGDHVQSQDAQQIYIATAQRYSFILEAKPNSGLDYAFTAVFDVNPDYSLPTAVFPLNATGFLKYGEENGLPDPLVLEEFDFLDDFTLKPYSNTPLLVAPDNTVTLEFDFGFDSIAIPRAYFNNATYIHQKVPTLYSALSVGEDALNPAVYGAVNPYIIGKDQTVEIIVNNRHFAHHPFHLHGHHFQVCSRSPANSGPFNGDTSGFPLVPMQRDTVIINGNSSAVLRFRANNPGVWLFHCHLEWHVTLGLTATFIEAPMELQRHLVIPRQHLEVCEAQCMPTAGNAAGNTVNPLDLAGAKTEPDNPDTGAFYVSSACSTTTPTPPATTTPPPEESTPVPTPIPSITAVSPSPDESTPVATSSSYAPSIPSPPEESTPVATLSPSAPSIPSPDESTPVATWPPHVPSISSPLDESTPVATSSHYAPSFPSSPDESTPATASLPPATPISPPNESASATSPVAPNEPWPTPVAPIEPPSTEDCSEEPVETLYTTEITFVTEYVSQTSTVTVCATEVGYW